jgi:hypothetical protein
MRLVAERWSRKRPMRNDGDAGITLRADAAGALARRGTSCASKDGASEAGGAPRAAWHATRSKIHTRLAADKGVGAYANVRRPKFIDTFE